MSWEGQVLSATSSKYQTAGRTTDCSRSEVNSALHPRFLHCSAGLAKPGKSPARSHNAQQNSAQNRFSCLTNTRTPAKGVLRNSSSRFLQKHYTEPIKNQIAPAKPSIQSEALGFEQHLGLGPWLQAQNPQGVHPCPQPCSRHKVFPLTCKDRAIPSPGAFPC